MHGDTMLNTDGVLLQVTGGKQAMVRWILRKCLGLISPWSNIITLPVACVPDACDHIARLSATAQNYYLDPCILIRK
jgi:hypothetical protein